MSGEWATHRPARMTVTGYIAGWKDGVLTIKAPFEAWYLLERRSITECEIRLDDGRQISGIQRRHIYALLRDISLWSGHTPEELKEIMKCDFLAQTGGTHFSLSDVDMTTAKDFLQFLIEFCLK